MYYYYLQILLYDLATFGAYAGTALLGIYGAGKIVIQTNDKSLDPKSMVIAFIHGVVYILLCGFFMYAVDLANKVMGG